MNARARAVLGLLLIAALLCLAGPADARDQEVSISVLTMGPGDPTFSKFGHNAIVVKPRRSRRALVYNFGTFTFKSPNLVSDFLNRRLNYWLSVDTLDDTLRSYRRQNRTIIEQRLALTPEQSSELAAALADNALPENRLYRYDYFLDNCSTRVRDALDRIVGGAIEKSAQREASQTFREHSLRLAGDDPLLYVGLDFGLSGFVDRPQTEWDEAFLPGRLADVLRQVKIDDGKGGTVPLVRSERVLFEAKRPPPPAEPPTRLPALLALGTALGAALLLLRARAGRAYRWLRGGLLIVLGVVAGGAGSLLLFFWVATGHEAAWANRNLMFAPPWLLLLAVAGAGIIADKRFGTRLLRLLMVATLASAGLGLLLGVTTLSAQVSMRIAALLVPIWLCIAAGEVLAEKRAGSDRPLRALLKP